jgi:hypothetical protein
MRFIDFLNESNRKSKQLRRLSITESEYTVQPKTKKARDLFKKLLNDGKVHLDSTVLSDGEPVKDVTIRVGKDSCLKFTDKKGNNYVIADMDLTTASQLISRSVGNTGPVVVDNSKKNFLRSSDLSSYKQPNSAERAEKIVEHVIHELNQTNKKYTFLVKTETSFWNRDVTKRHYVAVVPKAKSVDDIDLSSVQKFYYRSYTFIDGQDYSDQLANDQGSMTEREFKQHLVDKINSFVKRMEVGNVETFSKNVDRAKVFSGFQKL